MNIGKEEIKCVFFQQYNFIFKEFRNIIKIIEFSKEVLQDINIDKMYKRYMK